MRRIFVALLALAVAAAGVFLWLTAPGRVAGDPFAGLTGDAAKGREVFLAAGCASCHAAPGAKGDARLVLAGGEAFPSPFGTFYATNISPSTQGIGGWSAKDLMNALVYGTRKDGAHLYPAMPYTSYRLITAQDVLSLYDYLQTLPPSEAANRPPDVGFPFSWRRGLGLWNLMFLDRTWVMKTPATPQIARGRYLVEVLGHCAQCHTPRGMFGQIVRAQWLQGAPSPSGRGKIPGITPGTLDWAADDITYFLSTGAKPNFDTAGGLMVDVIDNWGQLPPDDRAAVVAYLKALPARQ